MKCTARLGFICLMLWTAGCTGGEQPVTDASSNESPSTPIPSPTPSPTPFEDARAFAQALRGMGYGCTYLREMSDGRFGERWGCMLRSGAFANFYVDKRLDKEVEPHPHLYGVYGANWFFSTHDCPAGVGVQRTLGGELAPGSIWERCYDRVNDNSFGGIGSATLRIVHLEGVPGAQGGWLAGAQIGNGRGDVRHSDTFGKAKRPDYPRTFFRRLPPGRYEVKLTHATCARSCVRSEAAPYECDVEVDLSEEERLVLEVTFERNRCYLSPTTAG